MPHPAGPSALVPLVWEVGHAASPAQPPSRWVAATVPGAVQLDWARAEGWEPYWKGNAFKAYRWMEDVWWTYRARVAPVEARAGHRLVLACGGVDYQFSVHVNGVCVHEQEGMFRPFEIDVTDAALRGAWIEVRLHPAPKVPGSKEDRTEARRCAKPAVAYGWDWHPRLIPLGIWRDTVLEWRSAARLQRVESTYALDVESRTATLTVAVAGTEAAEKAQWRWSLTSPSGSRVAHGSGVIRSGSGESRMQVPNVELWWPHDQGPQPLYVLEVELWDAAGHLLDRHGRRMGFRRARLVMNEGAWEGPEGFPKSRSHPPFTLEINGRSVFARGASWVPPEIFPGTITPETFKPLLRLAREAGMNLLRSWGGGIVNPPSFFDQCDALGIMVWQEFPLACNCYDDDPGYLRVLDAESRSIIRQVREHPSLVMWSGGNELFNAWSGMTDQAHALRLLNRNCYDLDPDTPFIPTSPVDGVGHGDYRFRDEHGREVHQIFATARNTAYTEFGCPGPSPVEYLSRFIPPEELWPPKPGTTWETHHAFNAWWPTTSWLFPEVVEHYFGPCPDLPTLVKGGEWLQTEGYKVLYEEARRQKPRSSMALNWCYNEPWPTAANNSIINWPAEPKPAYHGVAAACRTVMASARIPRFSWSPGEAFEAELWLLNDSPEALPPGRVTAEIVWGSRVIEAAVWDHAEVAVNRHLGGPQVRVQLPADGSVVSFALHLRVAGAPQRDSVYPMPLVRAAAPT